jgi:polysaccharide export outer membrane protein
MMRIFRAATLVFAGITAITANPNDPESNASVIDLKDRTLYHLGPGDEIRVQQANAEELDGKVARVDAKGFVTLPLAGRLHVEDLTIDEVGALISSRLGELLLNPNPIVSITEYRSQPVSVLGAVNSPGVVQLEGRKTLLETLSLAGGMRPDAGGGVEITRRIAYGRIAGGREVMDPSGEFSVARIDVTRLLNGENPADNIIILPNDVVTVPRMEVIYVTGQVHKPGGFPLGADNNGITVLQAVSLAEGLGPQASPKNSKIFRSVGEGKDRLEIPVNLSAILSGKTEDLELKPRDILFVPDSLPKKAGLRAAEAAIQAATGVVIWRR